MGAWEEQETLQRYGKITGRCCEATPTVVSTAAYISRFLFGGITVENATRAVVKIAVDLSLYREEKKRGCAIDVTFQWPLSEIHMVDTGVLIPKQHWVK